MTLRSWFPVEVLATFVATRAILTLVGFLSITAVAPNPYRFDWDASDHPLVNAWSRWDSYWYVRIADDGYGYIPGKESSVAFFPLYPMLIRLAGWFVGASGPEMLAILGIVISNLALLAAVAAVILLVRLDFDEATARRTASYLLLFPSSFFLSAVYPESLFLALAVASLYFARTDRWVVAALLATAATLTRPYGLFLAVALVFEYAAQRGFRLRAVRPDVLALGLIPSALAAYFLYLGASFGDPLAALHAQKAWGRELTVPWDAFTTFFSAPFSKHGGKHSPFDLGFTLVSLVLVALSWRFVRPSYALFATVLLLGVLSTGTLWSMVRFAVSPFPAFIVLAIAGRHPLFDRAYVVVSVGLGALFMGMYAQWYWVG